MDIMRDGPTLVLADDFDVRSTWEVRTAIYELLGSHDGDVVVDLTGRGRRRPDRAQGARGRHPARPAGTGTTSSLRGCSAAVRRLLHLSHLHADGRGGALDRAPAGRPPACRITLTAQRLPRG